MTVEDNNRFGLDLDSPRACVLTRATSPRTSSPTLTTRPQCSEDPYILLTSGKVSSQQDIVHVAELVMKTGKPLLISSLRTSTAKHCRP